MRNKPLNCWGRFGALGQPILYSLQIKLELGRVGQGIVMTDDFNKTAIPGRSFFGDHDTVEGTFFRAFAG